MPGPEICDPLELLKPVITHVPLYNFLTYMSSSGGTVNDAQVVHLMPRRKVQDENEAANHRKNISTSRKAHPLIGALPLCENAVR